MAIDLLTLEFRRVTLELNQSALTWAERLG